MEGLLAHLQHASLGKKELFDLLMNLDLNTLHPAPSSATKEEKIYNHDATLMETIVIHPMREPVAIEPCPPMETLPSNVENETPEIIEQIIFYPVSASETPTIVYPSLPPAVLTPASPLVPPEPEPIPSTPSTPSTISTPPLQEDSPSQNIMESLFQLKRAPAEEKAVPTYTCRACQRIFKRQHLLSQHHEISLSCSQWLAREVSVPSIASKGIHQLVHDCLNRASRGEEEDKNECLYCHAPFTTKESQRAHFQTSASCNRRAIEAFKQMILAL